MGSRKQEQKYRKASSTSEVKDRREVNTSINLTKGHEMMTFNESIPHLRVVSNKPMTVIIFLVFNITRGEIKPDFL